MARFTDDKGRVWRVAIDVGAAKRVKARTDADLLKAIEDGGLLRQLGEDPVLLVDVLYALCLPQAERDGIDEDAFVEGLVGDAIESAADALVEGLVDFFPQRRAALLRAIFAKTERAADLAMTSLEKGVANGDYDDVIEKAVAGASARPPSSGG